jgi:hypothetical protein
MGLRGPTRGGKAGPRPPRITSRCCLPSEKRSFSAWKLFVQKNSANTTQSSSQATSQQLGSKAQIVWQQPRSSHPGVPLGEKQLPASGDPQPPWSQSQADTSPARCTHARSQLPSQQNGSILHTASQHASSEQRATGLGTQQPGSRASPHWGAGHASLGPSQSWRASSAQETSHCESQQNESWAHTSLQQSPSLQPAFSWAEQQLPPHGSPHSKAQPQSVCVRANSTHEMSHSTSQQYESTLQTASQHDSELLAGPSYGSQGDPASGSPHCGRRHTSSLSLELAAATHAASQLAVQQTGSFWQIRAQQSPWLQPGRSRSLKQFPASRMPHCDAQRRTAISTQTKSHDVEQQSGSSEHTVSQQYGSLQYGLAWGSRQGPFVPEAHPTGPEHRSDASVAHSASQDSVQQIGLTLQTMLQQLSESQPGLSWVLKQSPAQGQFQSDPEGGEHSARACAAQVASHAAEQQLGSARHTPLQHAVSRQPGLPCAEVQSPGAGQL